MQYGHLIALLNLGLALAVAAAFLALWLYQRHRPYLAVLALGYACTAIGFLMQVISPLGFELSRLVSCIGFLVGCCCVSGAVISRYGRRVPFLGLVLLAAAGFAAFSWFMFVQPALTWRVYSVNVALGGISLVAAAELRPVSRQGTIEMLVFFLSLLSGVNFLARTLVALWIDGPHMTYAGFYQSAYWTSALLSHALIAICLALCLFGSAALDVVRSLQADSRTDPLSGLLNRRGLAERSLPFFSRATSPQSSITLVLADLDHFKRINDTFGHAAGDAVIVAFARILRKEAALSDAIAARIGGEEFAVLLPGCGLGKARQFAERVRVSLPSLAPEALAGRHEPLTCTLGVAERVNGEGLDSLIERADEVLMQGKRAGRDRVRITYLRPSTAMPARAAA